MSRKRNTLLDLQDNDKQTVQQQFIINQKLIFSSDIFLQMNFDLFRQNYELKQVLGHGTQSTVRKVIRRDTRQIFAAKIYESFLVKARHQIDMLVKLDHPSIVNIYQVYQEQNCIILILEYMAGGQLYQRISQKKRLTQVEVKNYIKVLIDAVRYCHEYSVIHRDIKPENLLLTTNGPDAILKLADFGISKILTDGQLNTICGTPIYMAPEIWSMDSYNEKVDIWSIGVVTYYLLSGEYPFAGDNTQQLLKKVCHQEVTFKQKIWQQVSGRAIVFLREVLQKNKETRPSAIEVQHNIWFYESIPKMVEIEADANLEEAVINIRRQKVKAKRIRKQKEVMEMLHPSKQMPRVRMQFLSLREHQSTQSERHEETLD